MELNDSTRYWKFFWRIIFDVVDTDPIIESGIAKVAGAEPRVRLEVTLWDTDLRQRLGRRMSEPLPVVLLGMVTFNHEEAVFDGGGLQCQVHLLDEMQALLDDAEIGINLSMGEMANLAQAIQGENVNVVADVQLGANPGDSSYPIFHFPQPDLMPGVFLAESVTANGKQVVNWEISGHLFPPSPEFELVSNDPRHRIRVRQSWSPDSSLDPNVYWVLADSLPLGYWGGVVNDHAFEANNPQTFYIGGYLADSTDPASLVPFYGKIYHLDFDPNDSCGRCAAGPIEQ